MFASFRAELFKLRKRPATWLLGGVWLALLLTFAYLLPYFSSGGSSGGGPGGDPVTDTLPANLVSNAVGGFALFGGALAMILGALVAGSEYGWGTVKTVFTQRPGRTPILAGTVAALAVLLLCLVLVTFAVAAGASATVAAVEGLPSDWPGLGEIAVGIAAGWLLLGMWCLFGLLLGALTRGTAMAIGLGLVWALVVENLIRASARAIDLLDTVQQALPGVNGGSLVAALGAVEQGQDEGTPGVAAVVSGTQATVTLIGFVLLFAVLTGVLQRRRDIA